MLLDSQKLRIVSVLKQFNCNEREASIYLQCLGMGPASIQQIARLEGANRFTVHSAVQQLLKKGLLTETMLGKRRLIVAEEPTILSVLLEQRKGDLDALQVNVEYVEKILSSLRVADSGRPAVRYYEGIDGFKKMLAESLAAKGEVLVFSYVDLLARLLGPEYLEGYFRKRAAKGIHTRLIFPPCRFVDQVQSKAKEYKITIRLLPAHFVWQSGTFLWNDNFAILSYTQQKLTCTILENKDIADYFRRVNFELCWQQARPV